MKHEGGGACIPPGLFFGFVLFVVALNVKFSRILKRHHHGISREF